MEGELRAPPEVICRLPQGSAEEAPKYQIVIGVVPGVPDGHVSEETIVCTKDVVCQGM